MNKLTRQEKAKTKNLNEHSVRANNSIHMGYQIMN